MWFDLVAHNMLVSTRQRHGVHITKERGMLVLVHGISLWGFSLVSKELRDYCVRGYRSV
jgi:hypothetical protein